MYITPRRLRRYSKLFRRYSQGEDLAPLVFLTRTFKRTTAHEEAVFYDPASRCLFSRLSTHSESNSWPAFYIEPRNLLADYKARNEARAGRFYTDRVRYRLRRNVFQLEPIDCPLWKRLNGVDNLHSTEDANREGGLLLVAPITPVQLQELCAAFEPREFVFPKLVLPPKRPNANSKPKAAPAT